MNILYGFIVARSKHGACKNPVWAGYTLFEREAHKKWILDNVSNVEYDGVTTFEDVESTVTISNVGQVIPLESGNFWHISAISTNGTCHGVVYKKSQLPKIIPEGLKIKHGYVNYTNSLTA